MKKILLQLDTDPHPSSFDAVVAADAGVDHLLSYGGVTPENVENLVHGAMFTRGPHELSHTAIFVGGSDVNAADAVGMKVTETFFGPMRVSVMLDANGSNTTAAAAVHAASLYGSLAGEPCTVLGGTGPVGGRVAQLLASIGAEVRLASRSETRAQSACDSIRAKIPEANLTAIQADSSQASLSGAQGSTVLFACGAAGATFLSESELFSLEGLKVAIDVNAVPPLGLGGIDVGDKGRERAGVICYGAIGVGGLKMKLHRRALESLFERNDQVLDTAAIYAMAKELA